MHTLFSFTCSTFSGKDVALLSVSGVESVQLWKDAQYVAIDPAQVKLGDVVRVLQDGMLKRATVADIAYHDEHGWHNPHVRANTITLVCADDQQETVLLVVETNKTVFTHPAGAWVLPAQLKAGDAVWSQERAQYFRFKEFK